MTKRTIYRHLLLLAALPALLLAACSGEDLAGTTDNGPEDADAAEIRFEIGFTPTTTDATGAPATRVATSADALFKCTWEDGDAIGIYAVEHGEELAAAGNPIHNVKMTYSTSGAAQWSGRAYWPAVSADTKLDFYAYYPYDPSFTDPTKTLDFSAKTDQSAVTEGRNHFSLSDLMVAKPNSNTGYGRGETVVLDFRHLMAMVQVKVSSSMLGNYAPAALKVSLNGCYAGVTRLNLSNRGANFVPTSSPETITMYPCPNDGTPGIYAYRALVMPSCIVQGTAMFRFDYSDGTVLLRSQPLAEAIDLGTSWVETFDMTFPFTSVTLSSSERLAGLITETELAKITHLKVMGEMTEADFTTICDKMTALTNLDLGGATVVGTINIDDVGNTVNGNAIPYGALIYKKGLREFIFPAGITAIGKSAFFSCEGLTGSLTIPEGVETIGEYAFYACDGFSGSLNLPKSLRTIGYEAFSKCKGLTGSLTIPGGVTSIGVNAFYNCAGLTGSLIIPKGVTSISEGAFQSCSGFTGALTIPAGVTSIGTSAFRDCSGFNGILTIPAGVTSIGSHTFYKCTSLQSITCHIPDLGQVTCGTDVFYDVPITITLYVPGGMVNTYQTTEPWKRFQDIQAIP